MQNGNERQPDVPSGNMPDEFDRLLGQFDGLTDTAQTKQTTIQTITPLLGTSTNHLVQTVRRKDVGDFIFVIEVGSQGARKFVLPPKVADAIARQRDALTTIVQRRHGQRLAAERKAAGILPNLDALKRGRELWAKRRKAGAVPKRKRRVKR
jgi:hypothetical protein